MQVGKVMSCPVITAAPGTTLREAAGRMRDHDIGSLPVIEGRRAVGIVTDRDIVLRALAAAGGALGPDTRVARIMTRDVLTCLAEDDVSEAAALMGERRVRRLLVMGRGGDAIGLVSVGDIAEHASEELAGQALGEISEARARDTRGGPVSPRPG